MYVKKILSLALPAMGEQVLQAAMGTVDSYLVAQLGVAAISGVSVANNLLGVYQAIFIGLATSIASLLAKEKGEKSQPLLASSLSLTVLVSLVLGGLALSLGQPLFGLMGLIGQFKAMAVIYFAWVGGSALLLGLMTVLSSLVRVQGRAQFPLVVNVLSSLANLVLSALFLFGLDWGVTGVALGTVLARLLGCALLWLALADKPQSLVAFSRLDAAMVRFSLPLIGERLMMRAGGVVVTVVVVSLGTAALAGQALGETLAQFNYMPGLALATAAVILVAQEEDLVKQKRLVAELYGLSILLMWLFSGTVFLLTDWLLPFFTREAELGQLAKLVVATSLFDTPFTAGTLILAATWQGLGRPKLPFYATTIGMWLGRVLGGYLLAKPLGLGLLGVYLAIALDNAFRTAFLFWQYRRYRPQHLL